MVTSLPTIGFINVGEMGGPIVRNLLAAGYTVYAFDLVNERMAAAISSGTIAASGLPDVVANGEIVLASLPSSETFATVAEGGIQPYIRSGQVVIDLGTTAPPETRRLAEAFAARGVDLLDVPVSGGLGGVMSKRLRMFVGGPEETVARCWPVLEAIGGPEYITYCGPSGSGQVVKGVNELMMGLANAAYLEALAFGINAGVDPEIVRKAIGDQGRWRQDFSDTVQQVMDGQGEQIDVKFRQLPYFLREAVERDFALPLTEMLYLFCNGGGRVTGDGQREAPSFWRELMTKRNAEKGAT